MMKFSALSKLKAFCRQQFQFGLSQAFFLLLLLLFFNRLENIVEKGKIYFTYYHFSRYVFKILKGLFDKGLTWISE